MPEHTEQQQRQILELAMQLGQVQGVTKPSASGKAFIFVRPVRGRQDLAGHLATARAQVIEAGLEAELNQAETDLAPTFAAAEKRSAAAKKGVTTKAAAKAAEQQAARQAEASRIQAADDALDRLYQGRKTAGDTHIAEVRALLVTATQQRRFETICGYIREGRERASAPVAAPVPAQPQAPRPDRLLTPEVQARPVGSTFDIRGVQQVVTGHSHEPFYLSQRAIDDEDLFEYEGVLMTYTYYRPATPEEIAAGAELAARLEREAHAEREQHARERDADPATHAGVLRRQVEQGGERDVQGGPLIHLLHVWHPSLPGMSTITLSADTEQLRVVERFAPYGDWSTDQSVHTLALPRLNTAGQAALARLVQLLGEAEARVDHAS